jgi:hypothetical protein
MSMSEIVRNLILREAQTRGIQPNESPEYRATGRF